MEAHLGHAITLADFARLAGMSRSHFSRAFRTTTGMPPHRWHLNARIRRAQALRGYYAIWDIDPTGIVPVGPGGLHLSGRHHRGRLRTAA